MDIEVFGIRFDMRILVTGGRDYQDQETVDCVLDMYSSVVGPITIIEGGAIGADKLANNWARDTGHPCVTYSANWGLHGKAAGPIRNQQMIDEGKPDLVVAFPGGKGTKDMVTRAEKAGIRFMEVVNLEEDTKEEV